jgi:hypothetical protein
MMEKEKTVWCKKRLENYFHNYILYLKMTNVLTEDMVTTIKKRKKGIINNIFKKDLSRRNYPFVIVTEPKLYCMLDIDSGFDLINTPLEDVGKIIDSRGRHRLEHEEAMAVVKAHEAELVLSGKSEDLSIELPLRVQWISRASCAEIVELI